MNVMQPVVRVRGAVHDKERHESGHKHVSGTAEYIDDIPEPAVKIDYRDLPHVTDVLEAAAANYPLVIDPLKLERGDIDAGFARAKNIVSGEMRIGGQDHFYLEGQISFAIPGEDDEVTVFSSTQHPSETQLMVAHVLGVPSNAVTVNVRRMGGGFGGKETQANLFAAVAAVAARKYRRAVKVRPDRDDD
ncbi:hypothetical protein BMJ22_25110, partial [Sinorhizobium medicae]